MPLGSKCEHSPGIFLNFYFISFCYFQILVLNKVYRTKYICFEIGNCLAIPDTLERHEEADDDRRSQESIRMSCGKHNFNFGIVENRQD